MPSHRFLDSPQPGFERASVCCEILMLATISMRMAFRSPNHTAARCIRPPLKQGRPQLSIALTRSCLNHQSYPQLLSGLLLFLEASRVPGTKSWNKSNAICFRRRTSSLHPTIFWEMVKFVDWVRQGRKVAALSKSPFRPQQGAELDLPAGCAKKDHPRRASWRTQCWRQLGDEEG